MTTASTTDEKATYQLSLDLDETAYTWATPAGTAKLLRVPRVDVDADEDGNADQDLQDAWNLILVDVGGVRRIDIQIDTEFGRLASLTRSDMDSINDLAGNAPESVKAFLLSLSR